MTVTLNSEAVKRFFPYPLLIYKISYLGSEKKTEELTKFISTIELGLFYIGKIVGDVNLYKNLIEVSCGDKPEIQKTLIRMVYQEELGMKDFTMEAIDPFGVQVIMELELENDLPVIKYSTDHTLFKQKSHTPLEIYGGLILDTYNTIKLGLLE